MKNLFEVLDNHFNLHKDSLNGTIVLGDDDNVCRKHIVIPFTSINREAWNNFFTICCNGWSEYSSYLHSWNKPAIYIADKGIRVHIVLLLLLVQKMQRVDIFMFMNHLS